jgi:hypothetical protein
MAYQTIVYPSLEYAKSVWNPYHQNLKKILAGVQSRAARFVIGNYKDHSPGSTMYIMIHQLQWYTIVERRRISRLIMLFKISHDLVDIYMLPFIYM